MSYQFISNRSELEQWCSDVGTPAWLAVDTEFVREKTYYAKLCLIQVATDTQTACIDPLAIDDLGSLWTLLFDEKITKVFHAARQDLEIFFDLHQRIPQPVFDTQVAATVLGYGDQIGYGNLVAKVLDIQLDKSQARTDWLQRPLDEEQLQYAANDVIYLGQIYQRLNESLDQHNRHDWLSDDFNTLTDPATYRNDADGAWKRVRGARNLKGKQWNILRGLAAWRESQAQTKDKPRKWILSDDILLEIAKRAPSDKARLAKIRGINERLIERQGAHLITIIQEACQAPADSAPEKKRSLNDMEDAQCDLLMAIVRIRAHENHVSPASLVTRKELDDLVRGERDLSVVSGWRKQLVGQDLLDLLEGKTQLLIEQNKVSLCSRS